MAVKSKNDLVHRPIPIPIPIPIYIYIPIPIYIYIYIYIYTYTYIYIAKRFSNPRKESTPCDGDGKRKENK